MLNHLKDPVKKWDEKICRTEKRIASFLFLLMSLVILADVIHRVFSRTPGRTASILASILNSNPSNLDPWINRLLIPFFLFLISYAAIRTRSRLMNSPMNIGALVFKSAISSLIIAGITSGFIQWIPSGLVWSPYFGLSCMLWLGLLGASIATHQGQHLSLEMGAKLWPSKLLPYVTRLCAFLVGLFCFFIAILALLSVKDHYSDWISAPGAGLIPSIEWPKWLVYLVIPYSFTMMGFRFLFRSLGWLEYSSQGLIPPQEENT